MVDTNSVFRCPCVALRAVRSGVAAKTYGRARLTDTPREFARHFLQAREISQENY